MQIDKQIKWRFNVRRRFSWFVEFFQIRGTNQDIFNKILGLNFAYSNMKKDADYNEFVDEREHNLSLAVIKEKTRQNFDFLWEIAERSYAKSQKLVSTAKKLSMANYKDLSDPELKILFDEMALQLMEYQPIMFLIFPVENYLEENLKKIVDLKKLEDAVNEVFAGGKGASAINEALAAVNSTKINSIINEIIEKSEWQKNEQKEMQGFCKAFAMRTALKKCGLMIDYSQVEVPGMKRLKKKKA